MKETEVGTPATRSFLHSFPLSLLLPHTHRHPRASVTQKQNSDECLSQIKFSFDRAFIAAYEFYSLYFGGKMLLYGCEGFTFFFSSGFLVDFLFLCLPVVVVVVGASRFVAARSFRGAVCLCSCVVRVIVV